MIICKNDVTKIPVSLTVLSPIKIDIFLSLNKGKKRRKVFLNKTETEIHQMI